MRIFYAAYASPTTGLASSLWRENLYRALIRLGHEVVEFQGDLTEVFENLDPSDPRQARFIDRTRPATSAELLRQFRAAHRARPIDLFFSYFYDACVLPETIDEIRALGTRTINWFCNASYQLHLVSAIAPRYDWCLTPERFRIPDYVAIGARPVYCQMAANPDVYRPYDLPLEYDATFVGQAYGDRPVRVGELIDRGIDVRVWGPLWERYVEATAADRARRRLGALVREPRKALAGVVAGALLGRRENPAHAGGAGAAARAISENVRLPRAAVGPPLSDDEMIRIYSRSRINIGFSAVGETGATGAPVLQVRLRDLEVPMSGGFYLTARMEELGEFYDVGSEIVVYDDPEDLVEKVRWYLAHDAERRRIQEAGFRRARREHTWERRFDAAFREIGLT